MRYQRDLQTALTERYRRLAAAYFGDIAQELALVTNWIQAQPALRVILTEAEQAEPNLDFEAWQHDLQTRQRIGIEWPSRTEAGRTTLIWRLMQCIAETATTVHDPVRRFAYATSHTPVPQEQTSEFVTRVLKPLFDYLIGELRAESSVLYTLERYVRRIEWFDREELHGRYVKATNNGEAIYEKDLRKFLFLEGINMPFSQVKSASGLSDVISELETDDPLVCELKIFDGNTRGKRHLASGINQVTQYAHDHSKTVAYLVIINLSGRSLGLPSDQATKAWPPWLELAGVRVYLIAVRALPTVSASKQGKATPVTITRADLVDLDATNDAAAQ